MLPHIGRGVAAFSLFLWLITVHPSYRYRVDLSPRHCRLEPIRLSRARNLADDREECSGFC